MQYRKFVGRKQERNNNPSSRTNKILRTKVVLPVAGCRFARVFVFVSYFGFRGNKKVLSKLFLVVGIKEAIMESIGTQIFDKKNQRIFTFFPPERVLSLSVRDEAHSFLPCSCVCEVR
jgi:hypothetical protein